MGVKKQKVLLPTLSEREKILLLFMAASKEEITPIRVMKGMFLISERKRHLLPTSCSYEFAPFLFGPFSSEIFQDISALERKGLLESRRLAGMIWCFYKPTVLGRHHARRIADTFPNELVAYVKKVRKWTTKTPLSVILQAMYENFPQYF